MSFFQELKRRNVLRVALAYLLGSWLVLQAADVLFGVLQLPEWSLTLVAAILGLGFVPAIIVAWIYELTPEGLKRDQGAAAATPLQVQTGHKLDMAIVALFAVTIALLIWSKFDGPDVANQPVSQVDDRSDAMDAPSAEEPAATDDRITIAVLPFDNFGGNPDNEYFADGLADTILHKLAQSRELKVTARNSSFAYKGQNLDVRAIGKELGVTWLLEGSVQRQGEKLRVIAQLVETAEGSHAWSATYDRPADDLFALQDEIAADVAGNLQVSLAGDDDLEELGTDNLVAFDLIQLAKAIMFSPEMTSRMLDGLPFDDVRRLIDDALLQDPDYVGAWLALAQLYLYAAFNAPTPELAQAYVEEVATAVERAGDLAPENPYVRLEAGRLAWRRNDIDAAEDAAREALEANANIADAWRLLGLAFLRQQPDQAHLYFRRAQELDPATPVVYRQLALSIEHKDVDIAMEYRREALRRRPGDLRFVTDLAEAQANYYGRHDRAIEVALEAIAELGEENELRDEIIDQLTSLGAALEAERWLQRWANDAIDAQVHLFERIELHYSRRDLGEARRLATLAVENARGTVVFWVPLVLARICLAQDDFECARRSILEVHPEQEDPAFDPATTRRVLDSAWTVSALAYADRQLGNIDAARQRCAMVLPVLQPYPRWRKTTLDAICLKILDRPDEAIAALEEVLTLSELSFGPPEFTDWPLFADLAEYPRMRATIEEFARRRTQQRERAVALSQAYLEATP